MRFILFTPLSCEKCVEYVRMVLTSVFILAMTFVHISSFVFCFVLCTYFCFGFLRNVLYSHVGILGLLCFAKLNMHMCDRKNIDIRTYVPSIFKIIFVKLGAPPQYILTTYPKPVRTYVYVIASINIEKSEKAFLFFYSPPVRRVRLIVLKKGK